MDTKRQAELENQFDIPVVPWSEIADDVVYDLDPGQHVAVLGTTGTGKTTFSIDLLNRLVNMRDSHVCAIGVKARDDTLRKTGWPIIREWPPTYSQYEGRKVILWPKYSRPSTAKRTTGPVLRDALDEIMLEGAWRVFIDEMAYLVETLGLRAVLDEYWNGARSSHISLIAGTQRPAWLARSSVSQSDWVISFRINDVDDRNRAGEILGDRKRFAPLVGELRKEEHEFVIVKGNNAVISWVDEFAQ